MELTTCLHTFGHLIVGMASAADLATAQRSASSFAAQVLGALQRVKDTNAAELRSSAMGWGWGLDSYQAEHLNLKCETPYRKMDFRAHS